MLSTAKADIEDENLEAHVALCGQRYADISKRLQRIEIFLLIVFLVIVFGKDHALEIILKVLGFHG
jgi:hypothetical protein